MTLWYTKLHSKSALIFGDHTNAYYKDEATYHFSFTKQPGYTDLQPEYIWALNLSDTQYKNETIRESAINHAILDTD